MRIDYNRLLFSKDTIQPFFSDGRPLHDLALDAIDEMRVLEDVKIKVVELVDTDGKYLVVKGHRRAFVCGLLYEHGFLREASVKVVKAAKYSHFLSASTPRYTTLTVPGCPHMDRRITEEIEAFCAWTGNKPDWPCTYYTTRNITITRRC